MDEFGYLSRSRDRIHDSLCHYAHEFLKLFSQFLIFEGGKRGQTLVASGSKLSYELGLGTRYWQIDVLHAGHNVLTGKVTKYLTKLFPLRLNYKTWPFLMMLKMYFVHTVLFPSLSLSFLKQLSFLRWRDVSMAIRWKCLAYFVVVTTIQRFKTSVAVRIHHFTWLFQK